MAINRYTYIHNMSERKKTHTHSQTICLLCGLECGFTLWENALYKRRGRAQAVILSVHVCLILFLARGGWLCY